MGTLEDLNALVKKAFEKAEKKEDIEAYAEMNKLTEKAISENAELSKKHNELLHDYRDALLNTAVKKEPEPEHRTGVAPDFDAMLTEALAKQNAKK